VRRGGEKVRRYNKFRRCTDTLLLREIVLSIQFMRLTVKTRKEVELADNITSSHTVYAAAWISYSTGLPHQRLLRLPFTRHNPISLPLHRIDFLDPLRHPIFLVIFHLTS